jgi:hypothetical protein
MVVATNNLVWLVRLSWYIPEFLQTGVHLERFCDSVGPCASNIVVC